MLYNEASGTVAVCVKCSEPVCCKEPENVHWTLAWTEQEQSQLEDFLCYVHVAAINMIVNALYLNITQ